MNVDRQSAKILLVGEKTALLADLETLLAGLDYRTVVPANTIQEAAYRLEQDPVDLILVDMTLLMDSKTLQAIEIIREQQGISYVLVSSRSNAYRLKQIDLSHPFGYLLEPFQNVDVEITIDMWLSAGREERERKKAENQVKENEERYRFITENSRDFIWTLNADLEFTYVSPGCRQVLGYSPEELVNTPIKRRLAPESYERFKDVVARIREAISSKNYDQIHGRFEQQEIHKDGTIMWTDLNIAPMLLETGALRGVMGITRDITARKIAEDEVLKRERRLSLLTNNSPAYIAYIGAQDLKYYFVNKQFEQAFSRPLDEIFGKHVKDIIGEENFLFASKYIEEARSGKATYYENIFNLADGERWLRVNYVPDCDEKGCVTGIVILSYDITELKKAEANLKLALEEKDVLFQELNHRVKNNMQVIMSLMSLQSQKFDDFRLKAAFMETSSRIYAMAAVHEFLHQDKRLAAIDLKHYLTRLCQNTYQSYGNTGANINLTIDVTSINVTLKQAYPIGLVMNELLTNAFKYAFPRNTKGEIIVTGNLESADRARLVIKDNGIGLPKDFQLENTRSLGLKLVYSLINGQIGGEITVDSSNGTRFEIIIPL